MAQIRLQSGEVRLVSGDGMARLAQFLIGSHDEVIGKAGRNRHKGSVHLYAVL